MDYALQAVFDLAERCARHGLRWVVLSPGSRSAPLTLAFARHPAIGTLVVPDERSAAFIALGLAQQTGQPVALVCTSGSAGLNYAPAVAEAYFQQVPLLVFTADRPPEWVDQADGQTIRQQELFGRHVKASYHLPVDLSHPDAQWHLGRNLSEAYNLACAYPSGPVHLNAPFREPFYPAADQPLTYSSHLKIIEETSAQPALADIVWEQLVKSYTQANKVLLVVGQNRRDPRLLAALESLGLPVLADSIANLHGLGPLAVHHDFTLAQATRRQALGPADLLISLGQSVLSKSLKTYLRQHPPREHWHVQPAGAVADTFQSLTRVVRAQPVAFLQALAQCGPARPAWATELMQAGRQMAARLPGFFAALAAANEPLAELEVVHWLLTHLPARPLNLHVANSMPVRYVNALGLGTRHAQVEVFANRGTSGIDGSVSTAVGHALADPHRLNVLLAGDLAFMYDRNGLWHNYLPANLRIVVLNNHGGGIFRLIDGPKNLPELDEYFVTRQQARAEATARDLGLAYWAATHRDELMAVSPAFWAAPQAALLEVETQHQVNEAAWARLKALATSGG
ncbi:MAG: 2-succinyl-5-enolpyruvyl-6-hydroxy-3-cyclohexene-1-carboxylic-acid synthase [Bernardetiaceae bacterium]|nr:2-succinyl-5-enolpyruvyl-6-hydroxy-3-cyclohexene-1-carboxylic-acid synthase [Bernardetiaceae bacterium]